MAAACFQRCLRAIAALALAGALSTTAARATGGAVEVDVELVLAVDISYSMDEDEQRLQRGGYVAALTSPEFLAALKSGVHGRIAIAYTQWASYIDYQTLVGWTVVDGPESAKALADKLTEAPYRRARRTSVSGAIDGSVKLFEGNGYNGIRRVIDVSGDGPNNDGRVVTAARDEAVARGFIINGLPLVDMRPNLGFADIANLDVYYQDCVIGGPGSFMIPIRTRQQFVDATRTKLVLEIATRPEIPGIGGPDAVGVVPAQAGPPRVSCTVGESMWRDRWGN